MNIPNYINNIKTILIITGLCFIVNSVLAQSSNTEYFMSTSFSKTSLNPAKRPEKGYIGIPGFTNINLDYKTNTFNLDHFLFPGVGEGGKTGWFLNENVSYDDFMKNIASQNYLGANIDYTVLGVGFYVKDLFLSLDLSARINGSVNMPKDFFDFVKTGFATGDSGEKNYNLSNISANANAFAQLGIGASYPFLDHSLVLGAKVKVLFGIAHADFNLDNMRIQINDNLWQASTQASGNILIPNIHVGCDENNKVNSFDSEGSFSPTINGTGLGLDLGATYTPEGTKLTISAAVTDIGFISWDKNKMTYMATNPHEVIVTGNHIISIDESYDLYKDLGDAFNDAVAFYPSAASKTTTGLGAKLNWGVEYLLAKDKLNIGFLNNIYYNPVKTISEFTVAGAYRLFGGVEAGLSYSFVHSNFQTVGFALNLGSCFYIASDYVFPHVNSWFIPTTSQGLNVQLGLAVPIGKKHKKNG